MQNKGRHIHKKGQKCHTQVLHLPFRAAPSFQYLALHLPCQILSETHAIDLASERKAKFNAYGVTWYKRMPDHVSRKYTEHIKL